MLQYSVKKIDNEKVIFDFSSLPVQLKKMWAVITIIENHPLISFSLAIYKNDDYEEGTIIVSPYFYHKYPDLYAVGNKEYNTVRIYTNPIHRRKSQWKIIALLFRSFFYSNLNIYSDIAEDRSPLGQKAYLELKQEVKKMGNLDEKYFSTSGIIKNDFDEEKIPRDPCFPNVWYNNRIGGRFSGA